MPQTAFFSPRSRRIEVLAAFEAESPFTYMLMRGLGRWLSENPKRGVTITRQHVREPIPDLSRFDAVLYHGGYDAFDSRLRAFRKPAINITGQADPLPANSFLSDDLAVARLAFNHLREYGRSRIAIVTHSAYAFRRYRAAAFVEVARNAGIDPPIVDSPNNVAAMVEAIANIEKPLGLFVTDDALGQHACRAMADAGIAVPEDVAVVSVGNDVNICEFSQPPLSSVDNAVELRSYRGIEELIQQVHGRPPMKSPMLIAPRGVVMRRSSDMHAVADPDVRLALSFIRDHAADPIDVQDVVDFTQISRRALQQKFARYVQRTIHEEIWRVHLNLARHLLIETELPVYDVATRSGFGTLSNFCTMFRRREAMTPSEYRKRNRR